MRLTGKDFLTSERMQPKVTAPIRFPRFFVTSPAPCPYLPGKSERKVFTELRGDNADEEDILTAIAHHPILLERPIVVKGRRAVIARPPELVEDLL